ncbi:MAG: hypothetical protein AAF561_11015 [Planctomycetota bacterium]
MAVIDLADETIDLRQTLTERLARGEDIQLVRDGVSVADVTPVHLPSADDLEAVKAGIADMEAGRTMSVEEAKAAALADLDRYCEANGIRSSRSDQE